MIKAVSIYKYYIYENGITKWFEFEFEFTINKQMPKRMSYKFLANLKFESSGKLSLSDNENKERYGLEFKQFKSIEAVL